MTSNQTVHNEFSNVFEIDRALIPIILKKVHERKQSTKL